MAKQIDSTSGYSPEVEARRADYEKLVECIIHMINLESRRQPSLLDIEGPDAEINKPHLVHAISHHLYALHMHIDWYDPETMRRFYVEMRLWGDQQAAKRKKGREKFLAEERRKLKTQGDDGEGEWPETLTENEVAN